MTHGKIPPAEALDEAPAADGRSEDLGALEERFRHVMQRNREYNPISSPGLMFEVLKRVKGSVVADVGCGGGLFSHIAKLGWYHTASYVAESDAGSPWIVGVDVNDWASRKGLRHNYDAFVRGTSDRLRLPDASVDTVVCIENLEHLIYEQVERSLDEFERVARRRIVVTTPSPLHFIPEKQFRARARLLARRDIRIDEELFAKLASAVHKTCVDPRSMIDRGYRIELYQGEWRDHPVYVKDLAPTGEIARLDRPEGGFDTEDREEFGLEAYLEELARAYPPSPSTIASYAGVSREDAEELYERDTREGNRRADYLNLICASLLENDRISAESKRAFREVIREHRGSAEGGSGWIGRVRGLFRHRPGTSEGRP